MPGKPITDQQVRLYMTDRPYLNQRVAAARAGFQRTNGAPDRSKSGIAVPVQGHPRPYRSRSTGSGVVNGACANP